MRILRFEAPTVQEALSQVRKQLGPDAVILYTRKVRRGGVFGFLGTELAEITAGLEDGPLAQAPIAQAAASALRPLPFENAAARPRLRPELFTPAKRPDVLQSELNEGKVLSAALAPRAERRKQGGDLVPELQRWQKQLEKNGVEPETASQLLRGVNKELAEKGYPRAGTLHDLLARFASAAMKVSGPLETLPGRARVIAFIGPTGVGKTTNLVKLASQYALVHQLKVALLTADTYRIGAVEQLRIYRDIIDIPFEAVSTPEELRDALRRHADRDLIFFDTAGRSPQNRKQLQELRELLDAANPAEIHLVISATTKNADLLPIVGKFELVPVNRILVTKLDETRTYGILMNLASHFSIPVSYLSTGQNVPGDIEIATPERLAELVLGESRG